MVVIFTSDQRDGPERRTYPAFESLPETLELAGNIRERIGGVGGLDAYREARLRPLDIFRNVLAVEGYIAQIHADIRYSDATSAESLCTGVAAEAFLISLNCAPRTYRMADGAGGHPVDGAIAAFVKTVGDSIALSGIDLDLGQGPGRWSTSADLLMDMLASLNVVATCVLLGSGSPDDENPAGLIDREYGIVTGCALIAAYAMVLYQCVKNGGYRGQVLTDIRR